MLIVRPFARFVAAPAVLVLVLAACSGTADSTTTVAAVPTTAETTTTAVTTTTVADTTTTTSTIAATTTTLLAEGDVPVPDTSGDDWVAIVHELANFVEWLEANPDPDLVELVAVPGEQFASDFGARISEYQANGWHEGEDEFTIIIEAIPVLQPTDFDAIVDFVADATATTIFGADGEVVEARDDPPEYQGSFTLRLDEGFGWRIVEGRIFSQGG